MNHFHFPKLIATVGPSLAKETILSKVVNFVDIFKINLSSGFDDMKKKYIDTILKLDNSKTILLETKGSTIKVKNTLIQVKKNDTLFLDYAEYQEDATDTLLIDNKIFDQIPENALLTLQDNDLSFKISRKDGQLIATAQKAGKVGVDTVIGFEDFVPQTSFISPKDQKDIIRGIQSGVNSIIASGVKKAEHVQELKQFLLTHKGRDVRIIVKIHTPEAIEHIEEILKICDGVTFTAGGFEGDTKKVLENKIITLAKSLAKPVIIHIELDNIKSEKQDLNMVLNWYLERCVDSFLLDDETAYGDDPLAAINGLFDGMSKGKAPDSRTGSIEHMYHKDEHEIADYLAASALRMTKELYVKAIICFTETGYLAAKLSSIKADIPVIAFTKQDDTYRFINLLRGVKGYKISPSSSYMDLKRTGKEMIRMNFKGNISLDDKIVIVQAHELMKSPHIAHEDEHLAINGIEIYKFKDI